jgi:hypothetical protein
MRLALRITGWAAWQLLVAGFAFLTWVNLFSEYGIYSDPLVGSVTALICVAIALCLGTWLPIRRWRAEQRD